MNDDFFAFAAGPALWPPLDRAAASPCTRPGARHELIAMFARPYRLPRLLLPGLLPREPGLETLLGAAGWRHRRTAGRQATG